MGEQNTTFLICRKCKGTFFRNHIEGRSCPLCTAMKWAQIAKIAAPLIKSAAKAAAEVEARAFYGVPG